MTRARAAIFAIAVLIYGCAPAAPPAPRVEAPPAPAPPPPTPAPTAPGPFSDRELIDELARQGMGVAKPGEELPTEIRQTPRGVVVTFRNVLFAFDSSELTPQARREIERMAFVLNHPQAATRRVALEGFTDAIGSDAYNLELSRRRADAVAQELVARGVRRDRLTVEGFGKQRPVAPNTEQGKDNPAGRALNRRVEAIVQTIEGAPK